MHSFFKVITFSFFFYSCSIIDKLVDDNPFIVFQRTACYGTCPQYTVSIYHDGTINYHGLMFVDSIGCFSHKIPIAKVNQIKDLLYEINFFDLDSVYLAPMTDVPSVITQVNLCNKNHKVVDESKAPLEIKKIYHLIDSICDSIIEWETCSVLQ